MADQQLLRASLSESSLSRLDTEHDGSAILSPNFELGTRENITPVRRLSAMTLIQNVLPYTVVIGKVGLRGAAVLLPSFVRGGNKVESSPIPLSSGRQALAALNGLRGVACLIVFNYHMIFVWTYAADMSWGTIEDKSSTEPSPHKSVMQLPFIRLFYAGHAMVIIFFVISGYVLSHKPIKLFRAGKFEDLSGVLSSSVFRRGIRLFGPTLVGTFITMCLTSAGFFEASKGVRTDGDTYKGTNEEHPVHLDTPVQQFCDWLSSMTTLFGNVWSWNLFFNNYDPHLWTIPLEFRSSIVLFVCLLGFSRLLPTARLSLLSVLLPCCLILWARWEVFLFLSGMMLAELDIISGIFTEVSPLEEKEITRRHRSRTLMWSIIMVTGLFLSSCPSNRPQSAPGYSFLATHRPDGYDWQPGRPFQAVGGCLVVWSFMHLPRVQRIFTTGPAQYLGQISYAFYIVHGPILHGFGYRLVLRCWALTGKDSSLGFGSGLALAALFILPIAIWAADLFWRAIDTPIVQFAKWVEVKLSTHSNSQRHTVP